LGQPVTQPQCWHANGACAAPWEKGRKGVSKEGMEGGREGERKKVRKKKATSLWLPSNHNIYQMSV